MSVVLFLLLAHLLWGIKRHRYLFGRIRHLEDEHASLGNELNRHRLNSEKLVRAQIRIFDALYYRGLTPGLPLAFHGQFGEDIVAYDFFRAKGVTDGYFVEAGAFDGVDLSNTYVFEALGWHGLLVEPHPAFFAAARTRRPGSTVVQAALGATESGGTIELTDAGVLSFTAGDERHIERCRQDGASFNKISVAIRTLDSLLAESQVDRVHLLSLDIEGGELEALRGFDLARWNPLLLIIEIEEHRNRGDIDQQLARHGYGCVGRLLPGPNHFYVKEHDGANPAFATLHQH